MKRRDFLKSMTAIAAGAGLPVPLTPLPIAVQIIAAPWREDIALRIAYALEQKGIVRVPKPAGQ